MERSLRQVDGINVDEHAGQRRAWQYRQWVYSGLFLMIGPNLRRALMPSSPIVRYCWVFQERIRVYTKVLVDNRLGTLEQQYREAFTSWLRDVTLDGA